MWYDSTIKPFEPFLNRLWDNIQQCDHEDICPYCCWPWQKTLDKDGYGHISIAYNGHRRPWPAHRIVYEVWHGVLIPDALSACHYCDVAACCNPIHIWPGTRIENRLDCVAKARHAIGIQIGSHAKPETVARGERQHLAKLTADDVRAIRAAHREGSSAYSLGFEFGVSKQNVLDIIHRRTWKHI